MNDNECVSVDDFRQGMQCLASGVCIVATGHGDQRNGFTATAVMSLSDQPPSLVVGIGKMNRSHDQIRQTGKFSVNVLRSDQHYLADMFAGRRGLAGASRFSCGKWVDGQDGSPTLEDALTVFECTLTGEMSVLTHTLIVGRVTLITPPCGAQPLVYWQRGYNGVCQLKHLEPALT